MKALIAGAAGNLGSRAARRLLERGHHCRLLVHRTRPPADLVDHPGAEIIDADLDDPTTLGDACAGVDAVVHLAGVLFRPRPERFLRRTNVGYLQNLASAAVRAGAARYVLVSFPHVEGETTPDRRAQGAREAKPLGVHATTRLEAEHELWRICAGSVTRPLVLRAGVVYGPGVKLIEGARTLLRVRLMAIWRHTTWLHLLWLDDFLDILEKALVAPEAAGIYNIADDEPLPLQDFLDALADRGTSR